MKRYFLFCILITFLACGGSSSSSDDTADDSDDTADDSTDSDESTNALALAYPDDLAIASPTAATSTSSSSVSALVKFQATGGTTGGTTGFTTSGTGFETSGTTGGTTGSTTGGTTGGTTGSTTGGTTGGTTGSTTGGTTGGTTTGGTTGGTFVPVPPVEKKEAIGVILGAGSKEDLAFTIDLSKTITAPICFAPNMYQSGPGISTSIPTGDTGIITAETDEGEACAAAQINYIIGNIEAVFDLGLKVPAFALGAANIDGLSLPEDVGAPAVDLAPSMTSAAEVTGLDIIPETATLERKDDSTEGNPVYEVNIDAPLDTPLGEGELNITMTHIPEVVDSTTTDVAAAIKAATVEDGYCGRISQRLAGMPAGGNCSGASGTTEGVSVTYCKDADTGIVTYHMRRGYFCGADVAEADIFDDNGEVDPANKYDATSNPDGWGNNFYYIICAINPENGAGSCAQAWQAGPGDKNTRVLQVSVAADGTGKAYFGYGPAVEDYATIAAGAVQVGDISGMICNWAAFGAKIFGSKPIVEKVQYQEFAMNETIGLFESVEIHNSYALTDTCDKAAGQFAQGIQNPPTDSPLTSALINDLIPLADVDFEMPALPVLPIE